MTALETLLVVALAWVALTAIAVRIARYRHPPLGSFLTCDGVKLHYLSQGRPDAPALVLLHGNGAMLNDFVVSGVFALAADRFRVVCIDRPGFGYSERPRLTLWTPSAQAELLAKALDALEVRTPIVLGHSWGTLVALAFARIRPVKGLVLVSGYYFPTPRADVWLLSGPAIPIIGDLIVWTVAPIVSWLVWPSLIRRIFAPRPVPERFTKRFPKALALRPTQLRAASEDTVYMVPAAAQQSLFYAAIDCPTVILAAERDQIVEHEHAPRLKSVLPKAILRIEPGSGHMLHYAAPDRVLDAVNLVDAWPNQGPLPNGP